MSTDPDILESNIFQVRQWLKPILDMLKEMEAMARRQRQAGAPGPVKEPPKEEGR